MNYLTDEQLTERQLAEQLLCEHEHLKLYLLEDMVVRVHDTGGGGKGSDKYDYSDTTASEGWYIYGGHCDECEKMFTREELAEVIQRPVAKKIDIMPDGKFKVEWHLNKDWKEGDRVE